MILFLKKEKDVKMKEFGFKILKMFICIIIVIFIIFIFPIIVRFLIHVNLYKSLEEFKMYFDLFLNQYFLILFGIVLLGVILVVGNKNFIMNWLDNRDISFKHKEIEAEFKKSEMVEESAKKKEIINEFNTETGINNKTTMLEVKEELNNNQTRKSAGKADKVEYLENENNNLRFYSAYNIINKKAKELLNIIYCDKSMDIESFKNRLICSFKNRNKRNKNLSKSQINEYANNKYETIKEGLQFLNIIEISDDDKTITLTRYGKEFVEKYVEKEVGENEN